MKRALLALAILVSGLAACNKAPEPLTSAQIKQQIDSISAMRIKELDQQAQLDLEHRIKIEVKVKVDSIVNASLHPNTADSTKKKPALK